jgi:hypothetical protein
VFRSGLTDDYVADSLRSPVPGPIVRLVTGDW